MEPWRIEILGELRAVRGERVLAAFRTEKTGLLLGYLAYFGDRAHPREVLLDIFWPESDRDRAGNNLSKALSSLRAQLEPPGTPAGSVLAATRATIQLLPEAARTDVADFRAALELAGRASGEERLHALERASELYRGDLLPACYQDWARGERERLRAAFVRAGRQLTAALADLGQVHQAIDRALAVLAVDPLCEPAARDLMTLYARAGEPLAGLAHYEELARRLERELGAAPSAELKKLASELGATTRGPAPVTRPPTVAASAARAPVTVLLAFAVEGARRAALLELVQRHEGRAARIEDGEAVFGFARPRAALECAFAARRLLAAPGPPRVALEAGEAEGRALLLARAGHPGQVLVSEPAAALLRRDPDLEARIADLGVYRLDESTTPERIFQAEDGPAASFPALACPCLSSRPGPVEPTPFLGREEELGAVASALGASRLVTITGPGGIGKTRLAVEAGRLRGALGVVPLAPVDEAAAIPGAVAQALGLASPAESVEELVRGLPPGPKLLVLDNFEHLVVGGAELVATLLERASDLACLVTSRCVLGLEAEREVPLGPFPVPPAAAPVDELERFPSVRLLVDRARLASAGFALGAANATSVSELVRRLEGIPLALTLAAGALQVVTPEELLERLESPLDLPATRKRSVPARHRSLRAAIEGSYRLISPELRRLLAALSVFEGGFTVDAVESVCEEPLALDRLAELREFSFLQPVSTEGRLEMLETLRDFAREQLEPAVRAHLERRHAEHYAALAKRSLAELDGPRQSQWLERLGAERANVRAVFERCAGDPGLARAALVLAASLFRFWEARHLLAEGRRFTALALAASPEPSPERADALMTAGSLALRQGDRSATRALLEESASVSRRAGATRGLTRAVSILGTMAYDGGDWPEAERCYKELVATARTLGARNHLAIGLYNTVLLHSSRGNYEEALAAGDEALSLFAETDSHGPRAYLGVVLGEVNRMLGRHDRARALLEPSLASFRAARNDFAACQALTVLGDVAWSEGDDAAAAALYEEAVARRREGDDGLSSIHGLIGLAQLRRVRGDLPAARELVLQARASLGRSGRTFPELVALGELARVSVEEGDRAAARAELAGCLSGLRALGAKGSVVKPLEARALLARQEGDHGLAAALLGAVGAHRERLGTPRPAREVPGIEEELRSLRGTLGEERFTERWVAGRALSWEEAVALAVS